MKVHVELSLEWSTDSSAVFQKNTYISSSIKFDIFINKKYVLKTIISRLGLLPY